MNWINRFNKNLIYIDYVFVFFLSSMTRVYIALNSWPVYTVSDEVSAISIAAKLAGYDWSDIISNAGYYGIGYLFIYAPLFSMGLSSIVIYRIIVLGSAIVLGLTGLTCYRILEIFFKDIPRIYRILISSACGCLSIMNTYQPSMRNEEMLVLVCWLIILNLFYVINDIKAELHRWFIVFLCLYGLTLHTRGSIFIAGLVITSIISYIIKRRKILGIWNIAACIIGYVIIKELLDAYRQTIWTGIARNTSAANSAIISLARINIDKYYFKSLISILVGNLYTAYATSGGIFIVAVVAIYIFAVKIKKKRNYGNEDIALIWAGVLLSISIAITTVGLMLIWGDNVYVGLITDSEKWEYGYKAFTYMRYPGFLMPPLFMCGLIILLKISKNDRIFIACISLGIVVVLTGLWQILIFPYIKTQKSLLFITTTVLSYTTKISESTWYLTSKFFLMIAMMWFFLCRRKRGIMVIFIFLIIYTSSERIFAFNNLQRYNEKKFYESADAGTEIINILKNEKYKDKMDIYVLDTIKMDDHQVWYMYQFINYDVHIIPGMPDESEDEAILLSNGIVDGYDLLGYKLVYLDSNEYLYFRGDNIGRILQRYGYNVQ